MAMSNDKRPSSESTWRLLADIFGTEASEAVSRRSRCGWSEAAEIASSPGLAPRVIQRTANACSFLTLMSG